MSPSLLLGSLVVASLASGLPATSQRPAGDPQGRVPTVSEPLPAAMVEISETKQSATSEGKSPDILLAVPGLSVQVQSNRATYVNPTPRIVCGMKLWRVDPDVDPGIHRQLPEEAFDAAIRRIPPDRDCVPGASGVTGHSFTTTIKGLGVNLDLPVRK